MNKNEAKYFNTAQRMDEALIALLDMIIMIAMAAYAFTKITLATINLVKSRRSTSVTRLTLRNISFADALVSIFARQRSMLVSFEGMSESEIQIMNAVIGSVVCAAVFLLGANLFAKKKCDIVAFP